MMDVDSLLRIIKEVKPDEIYNLAAQSHVGVSFDVPFYTAQSDAIGVLNLLEVVKNLNIKCKIYQASTSELYSGDPKQAPQNEKTPFSPKSPYGVAKLYAFEIAKVYRESYGMFVVNGISFNHESPRRGENFVTRKISIGLNEVKSGKREKLILGNLNSKRDWGYAPEYIEAAWKMLQQKIPQDFVLATGETHSVREFVEEACKVLDIDIEWKGKRKNEKGIDRKTDKTIVEIDPLYFRPNEVRYLCGDSRKARKILNWNPKCNFKELVKIMVEADLKKEKNNLL
jgi:GDPmannose 4,6-dehydratase